MKKAANDELSYILNQVISNLQEEITTINHPEEEKNSAVLLSKNNLLAFLKLRKKQSQEINQKLIQAGLSVFSNIHPHIQYSIQKMQNNINKKIDKDMLSDLSPQLANEIRDNRNQTLFGKTNTSIMVTLQSSMLENPNIFQDLLTQGMNIARINCAHDNPETWKMFVDQVRKAETELGMVKKSCKIHMELAGPKLRVKNIYFPVKNIDKERLYFNVKKGDIVTIILQEEAADLFSKKAKIFSINTPHALQNVRIKDKVYFNDGKIIGEVFSVSDAMIGITINKTNKKVEKLREESGVNFPDSFVHFLMPAITETDLKLLPTIYELCDSIGISFIHHPRDLENLRTVLKTFPSKNIGIIAKIETKEALHNLSKIILEGLKFDAFGIMIARGDLAIELGFSQLAFIQEEIIQLCQSAHVPIIWATGVLENLTKKGMPLRSELTDAFNGLRTDCVMLNKGDYIVEAVKTLNELIIIKDSSDRERKRDVFSQYGF